MVFPIYKEKIKTVDELYKVLTTFNLEVQKNEINQLNEIKTHESNLNGEIMTKNDDMNKTQTIIINDMKNYRIPTLLTKIKSLTEIMIRSRYLEELPDDDEEETEEKTEEVEPTHVEQANKNEQEEEEQPRDLPEENTYEDLSDENLTPSLIIKELEKHKVICESYEKQCSDFKRYEKFLKLPETDFENVKTLKVDIVAKHTLWTGLRNWKKLVKEWEDTMFKEIQHDKIREEAENYGKKIGICKKSIPPDNALLRKFEDNIKRFGKTMPVVKALKNDKLSDEDHREIRKIIGQESLNLDNLKLKDLIEMQIFNYQNDIVKLSNQVTQESILKVEFDNLKIKWDTFKFDLSPHKEGKDSVLILGESEEMVKTLDDMLAKINVIYANRYLIKLKKDVHSKRNDIMLVGKVLDEWIKFQHQWVYLEKIFSSPDFKKDLKELGRFEKINNEYKSNAKTVNTNGPVSKNAHIKFLKKMDTVLVDFNKQLNEINKTINDFLDGKRTSIHRLHFVSNDEMIVILGKTETIQEIQLSIGKLFENVNEINCNPNTEVITGVKAREGEILYFKNNMAFSKADGFEKWLDTLEKNIEIAITDSIRDNLLVLAGSRNEKKVFYESGMSQAIMVCNQIYWSKFTKQYIDDYDEDPDSLKEWYRLIWDNIQLLTEIVRSGLEGYHHTIICSVVTSEVHNRDIVLDLIEKGVTSSADFAWEQQLRYDNNPSTKKLEIRQVDALFYYGYEYLGPTTRIVITPLTDKCWITITSALNIGLGAAPAGPAGTGKTESTKDLAKALGRFCIVFNCSEQVDVKMMERLFRGILCKGAWTCLDEFNRIDIEVLSVIAQQLLEMKNMMVQLIETNRDTKVTTLSREFKFIGKQITVNVNAGVFITMNPGYAGRTELPDNLKVLFRPVAMMIPDYGMIAEILLYSQGFSDSKNLAVKLKHLYSLSSEQLSQQKHYDFGMRAIKSVLEIAGRIKRQNPNEKEDILLIKAMRDSNLPKFLEDDLKLFNALVQDLFPSVVIKDIPNTELENGIVTTLKVKNLQYENCEKFKLKVIQLNDTLNVRFGTMVVGHAMVGKSTAINVLEMTTTTLKENKSKDKSYKLITSNVMNPKSITMGELYGEENLQTKDWHDGLASHYIRLATDCKDEDRRYWIIFDGPVDAKWIENMNSVLDDSRLLCLANGQRIRLGDNIRILFEVGDLQEASPATISR